MHELFAGNWTESQLLIRDAGMNSIHHAVLHALFTLASSDRHATVLRVVEEAGRYLPVVDRDQVVAALVALDRAGLADHERVRLTMRGLGVAVFMGAPKAAAKRRSIKRAA